MNAERTFFDTNLFVYAFDPDEPDKRAIATFAIKERASTGNAVISYQVWQEFVHVCTRKFKSPARLDETLEVFHHLRRSVDIVHSSVPLFACAYSLWARYSFQWHDSLIIAAAKEAGCGLLFSEDLQHGLDVDGMRIVNPFIA